MYSVNSVKLENNEYKFNEFEILMKVNSTSFKWKTIVHIIEQRTMRMHEEFYSI